MNTREVTRQYRLNQWIEIIRECRSSGQTVSAWCADHNINPKSYYYWLKRVREAACDEILRQIKQIDGITTRQIARLTGITQSVIVRV